MITHIRINWIIFDIFSCHFSPKFDTWLSGNLGQNSIYSIEKFKMLKECWKKLENIKKIFFYVDKKSEIIRKNKNFKDQKKIGKYNWKIFNYTSESVFVLYKLPIFDQCQKKKEREKKIEKHF